MAIRSCHRFPKFLTFRAKSNIQPFRTLAPLISCKHYHLRGQHLHLSRFSDFALWAFNSVFSSYSLLLFSLLSSSLLLSSLPLPPLSSSLSLSRSLCCATSPHGLGRRALKTSAFTRSMSSLLLSFHMIDSVVTPSITRDLTQTS